MLRKYWNITSTMVAFDMASAVVVKPPKGPAAPRSKSTNSQPTTKSVYTTRTLKTNAASAPSVYKARSDTSLTTSIRNLSLRGGSASSRSSTSSSSAASGSRRFNSAGRGSKSLEEIARQIASKHFKNIVVMAGAGISTASGIPDFRSPGTGLYDNLKQYRIPYPEAIFDIDYFAKNPKPFFTLAKELYPTGKYRPNYVHYFLRLLYEKGILLRVYTQNIDGLERLAGIPPAKLIEAHGSFVSASCIQCKQPYPQNEVKGAIFGNKIPRCKKTGCFGLVKPDIVFFGEDLSRRFYYYLRDFPQADLLLVMGTSLEVEPFASIVDSVRMYVPRVLFNREAVGPFEKKRRMNDIVVEGDIVEKIRGFALQLGWKKELDALIEESENQYRRSLLESSSSTSQDSSTGVSLLGDNCTTHSSNCISQTDRRNHNQGCSTGSNFLHQDNNKAANKEAAAEKKDTEKRRTNTAPSSQQSAPQQATAKTFERAICGPNSCFNPAQLRRSLTTTTAAATTNTTTSAAKGTVEAKPSNPPPANKPPTGLSAQTGDIQSSSSRPEPAQVCAGAKQDPGGTPGGGEGGGGTATGQAEVNQGQQKGHPSGQQQAAGEQDSSRCTKEPLDCRVPIEPMSTKHLRSTGSSGGGVKKTGTEASFTAGASSSAHSANSVFEDSKPATRDDDDLKGFFTMPEPTRIKKTLDCKPALPPKTFVHGAQRSPRATKITTTTPMTTSTTTPREMEATSTQNGSLSNRDMMVREWLAAGAGNQAPLPGGSSSPGSSSSPSNSSLPRDSCVQEQNTRTPQPDHPKQRPTTTATSTQVARSNSAQSIQGSSTSGTTKRAPVHPARGGYTREMVHMKMRYTLTQQQNNGVQTTLFQRTNKVPLLEEDRSRGDSLRKSKSITPTRSAFKHPVQGGGGAPSACKPPPTPDTRKPLFTGMRHIHLSTQPVVATVTKTTMNSSSSSAGTIRSKLHERGDPQQVLVVQEQTAAATSNQHALPRIAYRHRVPTDRVLNGGSVRMAPLLAQINGEQAKQSDCTPPIVGESK